MSRRVPRDVRRINEKLACFHPPAPNFSLTYCLDDGSFDLPLSMKPSEDSGRHILHMRAQGDPKIARMKGEADEEVAVPFRVTRFVGYVA